MSGPDNKGALANAGKQADAAFPVSKVGGAPQACPANAPKLAMHLDADRDGKVDDDTDGLSTWAYGKGKKGAIILCNNDDDDSDKKLDNENDVIDLAADESDIAPLVLRRTPAGTSFPPGFRAFLKVSHKDRIRVFEKRSGGAKEILGPKKGSTFEIPDLSPSEITLGMEAVTYPGVGFDGQIDLTLEVKTPSGETCGRQLARVRVAPWMMPNHLNESETVFVMDLGAKNQTFRTTLATKMTSAGVPAPKEVKGTDFGNDRWMQDVMELGFSSMPRVGSSPGASSHLPVVLRTPADRGFRNPGGPTGDDFPEQKLLGPDFGFHQTQPPKGKVSLDSFGNLECSPSVEVAGRKYPFGRIVYGYDPTRAMSSSVPMFLVGQHAQAPFSIDTSFLFVGHVDEIVSFCPMASASDIPKFRVLLASPSVALDILRDLQKAGQGTAPMFKAIDEPTPKDFDAATYNLQTPDAILADAKFVAVQKLVQAKIDGVERQVTSNLGLKKEHFIRLPVLFHEVKDGLQIRHLAYTPGVVNMLVVTKSNQKALLCIPKPFGPLVGGNCQFEQKITTLLTPLGNDIVYVDDFVPYHQVAGEIHCGTNTKRKPRADLFWWEVDPT